MGPGPSGGDAFVTKLSTTGSATFSTLVGGTGSEIGRGIAVDALGNIHVTGSTTLPGGFPTAGTTQLTAGALIDTFYAKYSSAGAVIYSTVFGGNGNDFPAGIGVDGTGNAYITGSDGSTDFAVTAGSDLRFPGGGGLEAFITKIGALPIATTTALTTSSATPTVGASITLTATVGGGTSPLGTVTFADNGTTLVGPGPVALVGNVATLATTTLAQGAHSITATYNGDGTNRASTSAAVAVTVGAAPSGGGGGGGGGGGCTVNPAGVADWTLLLMFAAAVLYRLRRSRQRI
jgi:hypothetical protein